MSPKHRIAYFAHSLRSDWNNGNAHFLRGLLSSLTRQGHDVVVYEPEEGWSLTNLLTEQDGQASLDQFLALYPELDIHTYSEEDISSTRSWLEKLAQVDVVIVHEWNPPELANTLLGLRDQLKFRLVFHDTHHRASSSPEQIRLFGIDRFDGVLAFGETLRSIYEERFSIHRVWTFHEAADTRIFKPHNHAEKTDDVLWIGNWGDEERSREIVEFLIEPARALPQRRFRLHGVRYPERATAILEDAGVRYGGYLPNLMAPSAYAAAHLTVHIPRQQYVSAMSGIPTIRVFEALACGVPLISAPWEDTEQLFRAGDFLYVRSSGEMIEAMRFLLSDPAAAERQAQQGLETIQARHTCDHRARELTSIIEEHLS